MTRRELFALIGAAAGSGVMYQAMTSLGHALESNYRGPLALETAIRRVLRFWCSARGWLA